MTTLPSTDPMMVEFDGADLWVQGRDALSRVRASDGRLLDTWTGMAQGGAVALAMGKVFVTSTPGRLLQVDPSQPAVAATTVATLASSASQLAFDGGRFWTANGAGTVSIVTPGAALPWTVTTTAGGYQGPFGILYDGANVWITDARDISSPGALLKLNASGGVLQTVTVGVFPALPVFDGSNIWVPCLFSGTVSVVRASTGVVLATLTGNGLSQPRAAAFDGRRVLVIGAQSPDLSLWNAANLAPIASVLLPPPGFPFAAASDGVSFWISLGLNPDPGRLVRF